MAVKLRTFLCSTRMEISLILSRFPNQYIPSDDNSQVYSLVCTYYTHDHHEDFKRIFYHLFGKLQLTAKANTVSSETLGTVSFNIILL